MKWLVLVVWVALVVSFGRLDWWSLSLVVFGMLSLCVGRLVVLSKAWPRRTYLCCMLIGMAAPMIFVYSYCVPL